MRNSGCLKAGQHEGGSSAGSAGESTVTRRRRSSAIDSRRRIVPIGTADGPLRVLYVLPCESASEIWNATVHAASSYMLVEREDRYRFYWAIYVRSVGRITVPYMRLLSRGTGSLVLGPLRPKYLSRVPVFSLRRALVTERMTRGGAPGPATWP